MKARRPFGGCIFSGWRVLGALAVMPILPGALGQGLRVSTSAGLEGMVELGVDSVPGAYYLLLEGGEVGSIRRPVDIVAGTGSNVRFLHRTRSDVAVFFRVQQVMRSAAVDSDGDGIDDPWELELRRKGAALNGADAGEDHDGNGRPDLEDYLAALRAVPEVGFAKVSTIVIEGGVVEVELLLSREFQGEIGYEVSGTAVMGAAGDYAPLSGVVAANGRSATIALNLVDNLAMDAPRTIFLTLKESGGVPTSYRLVGTSTHALVIADNDSRWSGRLVETGLSLPFELVISQRGGSLHATAVGGGGALPGGNWPVTLRVEDSGLHMVVGPIRSRAGSTMITAAGERWLYLDAPRASGGSGSDLGTTISGSFREEFIYVNEGARHLAITGERAVRGKFVMERTAAAPLRIESQLVAFPRQLP